MQNVEFKAELRDFAAARRQCQLLGARREAVLHQTDTYFRLTDGRLKMRECRGEACQWVFYHRPNRVSPRLSNFTILTDEQARRRWGTHSLKQWVTVSKTRELWTIGDIRIHLDQVVDLGGFIEFEAKVSRKFNTKMCHAAVAKLREAFGPLLGEPISASYSDLMHQIVAEKI